MIQFGSTLSCHRSFYGPYNVSSIISRFYGARKYLFNVLIRQLHNGISVSNRPPHFRSMSDGIHSLYAWVHQPTKQSNAHEALEPFLRKVCSEAKPTKYALCAALNFCTKFRNWHLGLQIHAQLIQNGHEDNLILNSGLVDFYAKCNEIEDARRVFDGMKQHDQVSWTSIILGYAQYGLAVEANLLFKQKLAGDIRPNCFTYVSIITACTKSEEPLELGSQLLAHVIKLGIMVNSFVVSALIDYYSKCGRVHEATSIFHATTTRDSILYNSLITGCCQNLYYEDALRLFVDMREEGVNPTDFTMSSILNACGSLSVLQLGRQAHCLVIKLGSVTNLFILSSLIDMYSKSGSIEEACYVFNQAIEKNSVLWTSMISGYAQSGRAEEGLELFDRMVEKGFLPDHIWFTAVITACNRAGLLDRAIAYFNKMRKDYGMAPKLDQYACLVDLHARKGHLRKAMQLMDGMPFNPNCVMLSSFLSCCKTYGAVDLGREAANRLFDLQPHNAAAYLTMAHIYAETGLWDEVTNIRKLMKQRRTKKSAAWSWVEVDGKIYVFLVGDMSHPKSEDIYVLLELLNLEIGEKNVNPDG